MAKSYEKKNDELVKRIVLARGYCEWCGRTDKQLHHHHIVTRTHRAYRHQLDNIICLCAGCHIMSPVSAHNDRTAFVQWLLTTDRASWFNGHHVESVENLAGRTVTIWRPIKCVAVPDEEEHGKLLTLFKALKKSVCSESTKIQIKEVSL